MSDEQKISKSGRTESVSSKVTNNHIKIGRHGAEMIMTSDPERDEKMLAQVGVPTGFQTPATLEERVKLVQKLISQSMGITLTDGDVPNKIGFDISTDSQRKVLFGVLKLMSDTNYRGTYQVPNNQILKQQFKDNEKPIEAQTKGYSVMTQTHIGGAYENIPSSPVIKITRRDLMSDSGMNPDERDDVRDFKIAMGDLCVKQNFLMWTRYARDEKGHIKKDRNGRTQFELVSTFSPVLNLNSILDPQTKQHLYYEIALAPVFLDEISREFGGVNGGYFLLIPKDCTDEISGAYKKRFPSRRGFTPEVIQALCWWFRLKVQDIQNRDKNPFTKRKGPTSLTISYFDLCRQLDYGERTIKNNRKRITQTLTDGISISQDLGYIKSSTYDPVSDEYTFELNIDYYPNHYKQESIDEQTGTLMKGGEQEPQQEETPPQERSLFD